MPPNRFRFGSVERKNRVKAISQQPRATMPGIIRLCGPRTPGERKVRLACDVCARPNVGAVAPRVATSDRDWTVVAFPDRVFDWYFPVRFLAFGIALTQLPGAVLPGGVRPGTDSPASVTFSWFTSSSWSWNS